MADVKLNVSSKVIHPIAIGCCQEVVLCLTDAAKTKTVDDSGLVYGTLENTGRRLSPSKNSNPINNVRCMDVYQYVVTYDDDQIDEEATLYCSDISVIDPYACVVRRLREELAVAPDWVVDKDHVTQTVDAPTKQFDVDIPVIDRINAVSVGLIQLDLGALFDDTGTLVADFSVGGYIVTNAAIVGGAAVDIQVISQTTGNDIIADAADNGAYLHPYANGIGGTASPEVVSVDISSTVGSPHDIGTPLVWSYTNNSAREVDVFLFGKNSMVVDLNSPGQIEVQVHDTLTVTTGGTPVVTNPLYVKPEGPNASDIVTTFDIDVPSGYIVPPGDSVQVSRQLRVNTIANGAGSNVVARNIDMRHIAVAKG